MRIFREFSFQDFFLQFSIRNTDRGIPCLQELLNSNQEVKAFTRKAVLQVAVHILHNPHPNMWKCGAAFLSEPDGTF